MMRRDQARIAGRLAAEAAMAGTALELGFHVAGVPAPWLFDGLMLGLFLRNRAARWPGIALAGVIGACVAAPLHLDDMLDFAMRVAGSSILLALSLAIARLIRFDIAGLAAPRRMAAAAAGFLLAAPMLTAAMLAAIHIDMGLALAPAESLRWLAVESCGLAIMAPLAAGFGRREMALLFVPPMLGLTVRVLALFGLAAGLLLVATSTPLAALLFPLLLIVVGPLGMPGALLAVSIVGVAVFAGIAMEQGPLVAMLGDNPWRLHVAAQAAVLVLAATAYPLGVAVSERRTLNQAVADNHARMSRSERRYRLLADNASDIITRVRLDGRRLYCSPSVEDVLGWTPGEMMRPDWERHIHPDDLAGFIEARTRLAKGEAQVHNTYRHVRKDGSWCWLEARMSVVRDRNGQPTEFVSNLRDITRQKEAEQALEKVLDELAQMAATDGLTGVANRRRFDAALGDAWRQSLRERTPLSVLLIDADHFKTYNDRYGHQAGDDCLRAVAGAAAGCMRRTGDLAARYGGEEFAVILGNTDLAGASHVAERIRAAVEALDLVHEGNPDGVVTVSIGAASIVALPGLEPASLVEVADTALYAAKRNGRNRVEAHSPVDGPSNVVPLHAGTRRGRATAAT